METFWAILWFLKKIRLLLLLVKGFQGTNSCVNVLNGGSRITFSTIGTLVLLTQSFNTTFRGTLYSTCNATTSLVYVKHFLINTTYIKVLCCMSQCLMWINEDEKNIYIFEINIFCDIVGIVAMVQWTTMNWLDVSEVVIRKLIAFNSNK